MGVIWLPGRFWSWPSNGEPKSCRWWLQTKSVHPIAGIASLNPDDPTVHPWTGAKRAKLSVLCGLDGQHTLSSVSIKETLTNYRRLWAHVRVRRTAISSEHVTKPCDPAWAAVWRDTEDGFTCRRFGPPLPGWWLSCDSGWELAKLTKLGREWEKFQKLHLYTVIMLTTSTHWKWKPMAHIQAMIISVPNWVLKFF